MKANIGTTDSVIRILAALLIMILYYTNQITGTAAIILDVLAIIFVAASIASFCSLYLPFGISTKTKS
ncbi:YgaP family membrane protein [Pedobacter arcticus]|uniref:YgaP family membrane protein n=1 Tax=Pedobacter arcticus TaxID=752140 RepID=UPI0003621A11|nr:DUF2892 domain-containing protein [Pedobacter arcticus]